MTDTKTMELGFFLIYIATFMLLVGGFLLWGVITLKLKQKEG